MFHHEALLHCVQAMLKVAEVLAEKNRYTNKTYCLKTYSKEIQEGEIRELKMKKYITGKNYYLLLNFATEINLF